MFSTMEKRESLPEALRVELESRGVDLHNPTAKMAWGRHSDLTKLFAALLYFFDPLIKNGRASFSASRPKPRARLQELIGSKSRWMIGTMSLAQGVRYPPDYDPLGNVGTPDFRSRADLKGLTTVLNHPEMDSVKSYLDAFRTRLSLQSINKTS